MIFKATLQTVFYPKPNLLFSRSIPPRPNINIVNLYYHNKSSHDRLTFSSEQSTSAAVG